LAAIISEAKGKSPMLQEIGHAAKSKDQVGNPKRPAAVTAADR
jgi:hypothetical protein